MEESLVQYRGMSLSALLRMARQLEGRQLAGDVDLFTVNDGSAAARLLRAETVVRRLEVCEGEWCVYAPYPRIHAKVSPRDLTPLDRSKWSVGAVCEFVVLPAARCLPGPVTEKFYSRVVESLGDLGKEFEGYFVSQARGASFCSLVHALAGYARSHRKDFDVAYFWIDSFGANQPLLETGSPKELEERFDALSRALHVAIKNFQGRLLFLDNWREPLPLQRAWCIWEIYGCCDAQVDIEIVTDPTRYDAEFVAFRQDLLSSATDSGDGVTVAHVLGKLDVSQLECQSETDKAMIRKACESLPGGFHKVKKAVTRSLIPWLKWLCKRAAEPSADDDLWNDAKSIAYLLIGAGDTMRGLGEVGTALSYFDRASEVLNSKRCTDPEVHIRLYKDRAAAYLEQGAYEKALERVDSAIAFLGTACSAGSESYNRVLHAELLNVNQGR